MRVAVGDAVRVVVAVEGGVFVAPGVGVDFAGAPTLKLAALSFHSYSVDQPGLKTPTLTLYVPAVAFAGTRQLA